MNLTGRPLYMKGAGNRRARPPNLAEQAHMCRVAQLPCVVADLECNYNGREVTLQHCGTGGGGRRNHMLVIPLCWEHHLGAKGIDGKRMSKRDWQLEYGQEDILLLRVARRLTIQTSKE